MKIAVTGAAGLLGWHAAARIYAVNCAARFRGEAVPHELVRIGRATFKDADALAAALVGAEAVLHFAGVNRASEGDIESANLAIAGRLLEGCAAAGATPHIVYANSTHAASETPYGLSKRIAGEQLAAGATGGYTDLVLPHIFGECARPYYNNVTATLIDQLWSGVEPTIDPNGSVTLFHAGEAAQVAIDAAFARATSRIAPEGRPMSIIALYDKLAGFHRSYTANIYPPLDDSFDLALFNSYRAAGYPKYYPFALKCNSDARGTLFEAAKGGSGGQSFMSWTVPGAVRGDHFHLGKVERFLVAKGEAVIRIRRVLTGDTHEFRVSGDTPTAVDMPTLHTHNIENVGEDELLTLFWTHDMFDPARPDTYADPV